MHERVGAVADHDTVDRVVRAYWSLRTQAMDAGFRRASRPLGRDILELDFEDWLVDHLEAFDEIGLNLTLWSTAENPTAGRQCRLPTGGRPDLICVDDEDNPVVLELKTNVGNASSVEQLVGYLDPVAELLGRSAEDCQGVLVSDGTVEGAPRTLTR